MLSLEGKRGRWQNRGSATSFLQKFTSLVCQDRSPYGTRNVTLEDLRSSASHRIITSHRFGACGRFRRAYIHAGEGVSTYYKEHRRDCIFYALGGERKIWTILGIYSNEIS